MAGYRILAVTRTDADGIVHCTVVDDGRDERAALRLLPPGADQELVARFLRDAQVLAELSHPCAPAVRAVGEAPQGAYVITEELHGRSVVSVLEHGLPAAQTARMLEDVAGALDAVHGAGMLHRELRPANIVTGGWLVVRPLLVGFALGREPRGGSVDAAQIPYAAPEELRGEAVGPPADRYSLACTLFELLTGAPPFGRASDAARSGHLNSPFAWPRAIQPDLDPALDRVFERALAKDGDERHASAAELVSEFVQAVFGGIEPGAAGDAAAEAAPATAAAADANGSSAVDHEPQTSGLAGMPLPAAEPVATPEPEDPEATEPELAERAEAAPAAPEPAEPDLPEPDLPKPEIAEPDVGEREPARPEAAEPEPPARAVLPDGDVAEEDRTPAPSRRRAGVGVPVALAVTAIAAAAGLLLGRLLDGDETAPATAAAGPIAVELPDGWRRSASGPRIGGLEFERPLAIGAPGGGGMVAGVTPDRRDVLDPVRVAERVGELPPRARVVRIAAAEAYRWDGLRSRNGGRRVILYAVPTSAGAVTLACHGTAASGGGGDACARAVGSLRLRGARPYGPVAAARWRERVQDVLGRLRPRRTAGRRDLFNALDDRDQARAADSLARAHRTVLAALGQGSVPPQAAAAQRRLTDALMSAERAYARLARAVRRRDQAAFTAAIAAIRRAEARLRGELRSI